MKNQRPIELNIDELVLHGFPPGERYAIADAVEQTLSQLLTEQIASEGIPGKAIGIGHRGRREHQGEPGSSSSVRLLVSSALSVFYCLRVAWDTIIFHSPSRLM